MRFDDFYWGMDESQRFEYCKKVGMSQKYVEYHLIPSRVRRPRKIPARKNLQTMAIETGGACDLSCVLEYFYRQEAA